MKYRDVIKLLDGDGWKHHHIVGTPSVNVFRDPGVVNNDGQVNGNVLLMPRRA